MSRAPRDWFALSLLTAYALAWVGLGLDPLDRSDWVLENLLVFVSLPFLILGHRRVRFSRVALVSLFVFLVLHAVGGHWSYSNVPLDWEGWGFERNHYDRVVHFSFGLLLWLPARQAFQRLYALRAFGAGAFAFTVIMTGSAVYEIVEWATVEIVAPDLGAAFLGAQGDEFDAEKDMALAGLGTLVAAGTAAVVWSLRRRGPGTLAAAPSRAPPSAATGAIAPKPPAR